MPGEYVARWTGGRIGLGATVFHCQGTDSPSAAKAAADLFAAFFTPWITDRPTGISISFDPEFKNLTANGVLTSVVPITAPATANSTGTGNWTNGVGAMVRWNTSSIVAGRRLLGRTYLVPLSGSAFSGGNVVTGTQGRIQSAANSLISGLAANGTPLQIWSKKNGVVADVISAQVPTRPQTLRSRNDRD